MALAEELYSIVVVRLYELLPHFHLGHYSIVKLYVTYVQIQGLVADDLWLKYQVCDVDWVDGCYISGVETFFAEDTHIDVAKVKAYQILESFFGFLIPTETLAFK